MRHLAPLLLALAVGAPAIPAVSAETDRDLWGVGRTGVMCYQLPCPWQGVFPISETGERGRPYAVDDVGAAFSGDPLVLAEIEDVFASDGCLVVVGRHAAGVLHIEEIVEPCP